MITYRTGKLFANHLADKAWYSGSTRISATTYNFFKKKTQKDNPIKKLAKDLNKNFSKNVSTAS